MLDVSAAPRSPISMMRDMLWKRRQVGAGHVVGYGQVAERFRRQAQEVSATIAKTAMLPMLAMVALIMKIKVADVP